MTARCLVIVAVLVVFGGSSAQNVASIGNGQIDTLLRNPNYVAKQISCVLDKGPCDRLGGQLKLAIPEVLNTNCARCTPQQAVNARKLINFIQTNYPKVYQETIAKYRKHQG